MVEEWNRELRKSVVDRERLAGLGGEIQSLLTGVQTPDRKEADLKTRSLLTDAQSPLFAGIDFSSGLVDEDQFRITQIRESIEHARERSKETLTDPEQAEFDRCRQLWQQIVWSLLTSAEARFNH